jgi:hypothetical protein
MVDTTSPVAWAAKSYPEIEEIAEREVLFEGFVDELEALLLTVHE